MKKFLAITLAATMGISSLTGCSNKGKEVKVTTEKSKEIKQEKENIIKLDDVKKNATLLSSIKTKYAAAKPETEFKDALYNVSKDYTFSFDCNEEALRDVAYDAFGVYTTTDYENPDKYIRDCASVSMSNGKITVKPAVVDVFYDIPDQIITADTNASGAWKTETNGTWGNLNRLYLVQKYDLQTGKKLDTPIVTPFTIEHDVESTTVKQKIDENNNYYLEWMPVNGAESYLVYRLNGTSFTLVDKTTDTKVSSDTFKGQLHSNKLSDIVNKELAENGYDTTTTEKMNMNSDLYNNKDSKFIVVAVKDGKTSGISNIVDPNELADALPYEVANHNIEVTINDINDMPAYVEMKTVNGKTMKMVIDYHGASSKYEDDNSTTYYLYPKVYRTDLSPFKITIHGMPYGEFKTKAQDLATRQDKITATMPEVTTEPEVNVTYVPNKQEEERTAEIIKNNPGIGTITAPAENPVEEVHTETTPDSPVTGPVAPGTTDPSINPNKTSTDKHIDNKTITENKPVETVPETIVTEKPDDNLIRPTEPDLSEDMKNLTGNTGNDTDNSKETTSAKIVETAAEDTSDEDIDEELEEIEQEDSNKPVETIKETEKPTEKAVEEIETTVEGTEKTVEITIEETTEDVPEEETEELEKETEEETEKSEEETEEEETEDKTEEDSETEIPVSTCNGKPEQLMLEVAAGVDNNIRIIENKSGISIDNVLFADSALEEWIAYCLIARSEYIPVPTSEFPEANDIEEAARVLTSAYRQNPTSGVIADISYSYDYQTFLIKYSDDSKDRLDKTVKELKKAKEVADKVTGNLSNDCDKVIALNNYFCEKASYDHSSASTNVDMSSLSQSFIDAHTPYGILCNNYGVCESYSEAMALTGRLAGIDVIMEVGDLYGAGCHEWNRVKINGDWCILDITNNDSEEAPNALCNITDDMADQILIPNYSAYLFDASANTDQYEYYHQKDRYADSVDEMKTKLKEQLDNGKIAVVRYDSSISEDDAISVAKELYQEGYNLKEAYSVFGLFVLTQN